MFINEIKEHEAITSAGQAFQMYKHLKGEEQEIFVVIGMDTKRKVKYEHYVHIGTVNSVSINPRDIFREAIRRNCVSIICLHNHPSGEAEPSEADVKTTRTIRDGGKILGIELVDHVIIGGDDFYSFAEGNQFYNL